MVGDAGQPYSRKIKNLGGRLDPPIVIWFCGLLTVMSNLQFTSKTLRPKSSFVALPKYLEWRLTFYRCDRKGALTPIALKRWRPEKQNTASPGSHGQC
jgi:hypothetical protein